MIYKYEFSVSGDHFCPENLIKLIGDEFIVDSYFKSDDRKVNGEEYGYGSISFWHPQKYATEEVVRDYDRSFVDFVERNYSLFTEYGGDDFQFFVEIYYDGGQCNFEIFDKRLLKKLGSIGVSVPVSVYSLEVQEILKWETEINDAWGRS
ncbi:hypothetical protein [Sphingobacterium sp. MYb382]|uniref:hypothetical protein n=1 Tax=Sphingobacterium sp. MYb382 TaxID=2745278 RepID=UPI0030AA1093